MATKISEIPYGSRAPIRHAYDSVLTRLARLAAFSTCPLLSKWGEADQRLEDLAVDDLIALAIHLRRLLELTSQKAAASKVLMTAFVGGAPKQLPITRVANNLIHHTRLEILRRKSDFMPPPTREKPESWAEFLRASHIGLHPLAWLSSDQVENLAFRVDAFAEAIAKEVVAPVINYCDDNGLYLEELDRD